MQPADQVTILLTLKDRVPFTFRWMAYAERSRLPFTVVIADGGADDRVRCALEDPASFPHVRYEYIRYPPDSSYRDFYAKVEDALSRVRTPCVAMGDNDDFFLADGVREAAAFLSAHDDYVTCGGQCAMFWIGDGDAGDRAVPVYGRRIDWKCSADAQSRTDETARDRLRNPVLLGHAIYHHVRRTHELRSYFRTLRDLNIRDLFLHEQLIEALTAIAGKTRVLDSLYVARQRNAPESSARTHLGARGDWLGCMLAPTWSEDFAGYLAVTSAALAGRDGIPINAARRFIVSSYRSEMAPAILTDLLKEPSITLPRAVVVWAARRLLARPPGSAVRRLARTLYRHAGWIALDAVRGSRVIGRRAADRSAIGPIHRFLTRLASASSAP